MKKIALNLLPEKYRKLGGTEKNKEGLVHSGDLFMKKN